MVVLTPVLQKAGKCRFYQEIGGCYKGTIILKNSVPIRSIPFKCIFVRLDKALMREKNEREIPLALYIRLEYSEIMCWTQESNLGTPECKPGHTTH